MEPRDYSTIQAKGHCIICGENISFNINMPFCKKCKNDHRNKRLTDWIEGSFCHSCGKNEVISKHYPLCDDCNPFDRYKNSIDDAYLKKLNYYKQLSINEVKKIKPLWDCDKSQILYRPFLSEMKMCDILNIMHSTEILNTKDVFKNEPKDNRRIMNTLNMWKTGISINPPCIVHEDSFRISDGRHRILAAFFLGAETIPVFYCSNKK